MSAHSNILKLGLLSISIGFLTFIILKKQEIEKAVKKLAVKIVGIHNISIKFTEINADLYLQLVNESFTDFSLNTGLIKINTLKVFEKKSNKLLAFTNLNVNNIHIKSKGGFNLPKVKLSIPTLTGVSMALDQLSKNEQSIISKLSFEIDLSVSNFNKTIKF